MLEKNKVEEDKKEESTEKKAPTDAPQEVASTSEANTQAEDKAAEERVPQRRNAYRTWAEHRASRVTRATAHGRRRQRQRNSTTSTSSSPSQLPRVRRRKSSRPKKNQEQKKRVILKSKEAKRRRGDHQRQAPKHAKSKTATKPWGRRDTTPMPTLTPALALLAPAPATTPNLAALNHRARASAKSSPSSSSFGDQQCRRSHLYSARHWSTGRSACAISSSSTVMTSNEPGVDAKPMQTSASCQLCSGERTCTVGA